MSRRSSRPVDPDLLALVADDLTRLREDWDSEMSERRLRQDTVIIRRLLVDHGAGTLRPAWQMTGRRGDPRVIAPDLARILGDFPRARVKMANAGGVEWRGLVVAGGSLVEGSAAPGPEDADIMRDQSLSRFVDGPCMVVDGVSIKRRELIQYVANKKGGVHYDPVRQPEELAFKALDVAPFGFGVVVDGATWPLDAKYVELLAIGKLLVDSPAIAELLEELDGPG